MTYSPYTPGELTELRQTAADVQRAAPGAQAWPIVHKLIATVADIEADRDAAKDDLEKLRNAARALVDTLTSNGGGRPCGHCYALATVAEPLPRGGSAYRCDRHAAPPMTEQEREFDRTYGDDLGDGRPTVAAGPLRTLRALLGVKL